jgi:hypothetical protein
MTERAIVLACNPILATRIVGTAAALEAADWSAYNIVRLASDEMLVLGADAADLALTDEHAIVASDHGWAAAHLDAAALADLISRHIEWSVPTTRPAVAQGQIAGVAAKLHLPAGSDGATLLVHVSLAHELQERVG